MDVRQHDFGLYYTTGDNSKLCAEHLAIEYSRPFESYDKEEELRSALLRSELFADTPRADLPDTRWLSASLMRACPIGFSKNHLVGSIDHLGSDEG